MENEENHTKNIFDDSKNLFRTEFYGQSVKNNKSFKIWQNEMKKVYGNDAVLFKCKKYQVYFYALG